MSVSVFVGREIQPAALEIGRGPSRQTEVSVNLAARLRVATPRAKHRNDQRQRDSSSHTAQIALMEAGVHGAMVVRTVGDLTGLSPEWPATRSVGF
jgi:hypothetical protein